MRFFVLGAAALALSACGNGVAQGPCPTTGVLTDATKIVQFTPGSAEDISNVLVAGEIVNTSSGCIYRKSGLTAGVGIAIQMQTGQAGARARQVTYKLPYFVALTDANDRVLEKTFYEATLRLRDDTVAQKLETVDDIRISLDEGQTGADFRVIVGFQLTPQQLAYNRRKKRK